MFHLRDALALFHMSMFFFFPQARVTRSPEDTRSTEQQEKSNVRTDGTKKLWRQHVKNNNNPMPLSYIMPPFAMIFVKSSECGRGL
jgi:hypothetical protein